LYTLALGGKPDFGYMERLYNERNNMPLLGKAYLLKALHASNGNQAMIDELVRDLMNLAKIAPTSVHFEERNNDDYYWFFSSDAHTTALILQALIETQPENPLIHKTVRWLLDQRKNGCWRTTQENLFIVDALATYFKVYEKESPNFIASVQLAGNELVRQLFVGRSLQTVRAQQSYTSLSLGATYPVDFMKDGTGRLYYGLRMKYYLKEESKAKEEGFAVVKTIESEENPGKPLTTIKTGSILKVTLQIATNQTRNFVVVDDPVPAGLEIINTSFQTTANNLSREGIERSEYVFSHRELKDDRVLLFANYMRAGVHTFTYLVRATSFGTFAMPSTRAEGMYEPEVFGQTASKTIVIE
jgi:Large extracellular alpha-helical protein